MEEMLRLPRRTRLGEAFTRLLRNWPLNPLLEDDSSCGFAQPTNGFIIEAFSADAF